MKIGDYAYCNCAVCAEFGALREGEIKSIGDKYLTVTKGNKTWTITIKDAKIIKKEIGHSQTNLFK